MVMVNAIVKQDVDTWCVTGVLTNLQLTDGKLWETEADAIAYMQAHRLPYTTIRCHMFRGGNVHVEHSFHDPIDTPVNVFMNDFSDLF